MLFVAVSFSRSFEGMRGLNVTDVRRERIPLLWSNARQTSLTSAFYLNMERGGGGGGGGSKMYLCLQKNEAAWKGCTQYEGQRGRKEMSQRRNCDR